MVGFPLTNNVKKSQYPSLMRFHNTIFSITFIMQSLESDSKFCPEKHCKLKIKKRREKKKGERGTMYFQTAISLLCIFSYMNLMYIFYVYLP